MILKMCTGEEKKPLQRLYTLYCFIFYFFQALLSNALYFLMGYSFVQLKWDRSLLLLIFKPHDHRFMLCFMGCSWNLPEQSCFLLSLELWRSVRGKYVSPNRWLALPCHCIAPLTTWIIHAFISDLKTNRFYLGEYLKKYYSYLKSTCKRLWKDNSYISL